MVPSGTSHDRDRRHLHIVCTDPDECGNVILVPISTWTNELCDATCQLARHEHPWLTKEKSYVLYRRADFYKVMALECGLRNGVIKAREDCNAQVFLRVRNGICRSPHTPRKNQKGTELLISPLILVYITKMFSNWVPAFFIKDKELQ